MPTLQAVMIDIFPLIALLIGMRFNLYYLVYFALFLSAGTVYIIYQNAGNGLFSSYFFYDNAMLYTLNILTVLLGLLYILFKLDNTTRHYYVVITSSCLIFAVIVLLYNVWINAHFVENGGVFPGFHVVNASHSAGQQQVTP